MRAWPATDRCFALDSRIRARTGGKITASATPAAATHNITAGISTAFSREQPTRAPAHRSARPHQLRADQPYSAAAGDAAGRLVQPRRASARGENILEGLADVWGGSAARRGEAAPVCQRARVFRSRVAGR